MRSEAIVAAFALLSTCCLLCQMDDVLTDLLATGASHPLKLAIHRSARSQAVNFHKLDQRIPINHRNSEEYCKLEGGWRGAGLQQGPRCSY